MTAEMKGSAAVSRKPTPANPVKAIAKRDVHPFKRELGDLARASELIKEGKPVTIFRITTRTLKAGEDPTKIGYARGPGRKVLIFKLDDLDIKIAEQLKRELRLEEN